MTDDVMMPAPAGTCNFESFVLDTDNTLNSITQSVVSAVGACFSTACNDGTMVADCAQCLADMLTAPPVIPCNTTAPGQ